MTALGIGWCRDFEQNSGENDMEKSARLSRFNGASSISSDAYFNRAEAAPSGGSMGGSGSQAGRGAYGQDMDLTAAELVNRLSFHVSLAQVAWVVCCCSYLHLSTTSRLCEWSSAVNLQVLHPVIECCSGALCA